ncbi:MAG: class I SAM-dependent methyltransferase [Verrucomicrobiales bacterium]|nr:class I SAM-dependent methyltransferase [Verrucomicrobiales bacterium]
MTESFHSAVFMGLIPDETLQEYDTYPFGDWDGAETVSADDDEPMQAWIRNWAATDLPAGSRILVVGAGGGREIRALRSMGFEVFGLEFDIDLATETREMLATVPGCESVEILSPPRFEVPKADGAFDVILIARYYLSLVHGRDQRTHFLSELRPLLKEDGILAADYFIRPENQKSAGAMAFRIQVPIANFLRVFLRGKNEWIETGDHLDPGVPLFHHHYTTEEIESELIVGGFETLTRDSTWFGWSIATPGKKIGLTSNKETSSPAPAASPALT